MNWCKLAGNAGQTVKIRPLALRRLPGGTWLPRMDDHWRLERSPGNPSELYLSNAATGHRVKVDSDLINSYHVSGKLILKDQLIIEGKAVHRESLRPEYLLAASRRVPTQRAVQLRPRPTSVLPGAVLGAVALIGFVVWGLDELLPPHPPNGRD